MRELQPHQIVDGIPVGMSLAEMLKIGLGFLFGGPADDVREGEHVHGAAGVGSSASSVQRLFPWSAPGRLPA